MTDASYQRWDLWLKSFGAAGLAVTAVVGIVEYYVTAKHDHRA